MEYWLLVNSPWLVVFLLLLAIILLARAFLYAGRKNEERALNYSLAAVIIFLLIVIYGNWLVSHVTNIGQKAGVFSFVAF